MVEREGNRLGKGKDDSSGEEGGVESMGTGVGGEGDVLRGE